MMSEPAQKGSKSSTSIETVEQKQKAAILELGNKLIGDLDSRDLTAKWMAAHLSELMISAEDDPERKTECKKLILDLWRERRSLPGGDPLERYSQTLSALEVLLKTGQPLFEVWFDGTHRKKSEKNWAAIARQLRRHTDFLAGTAVKEAIKTDGLMEDELHGIAHLADPDDQTHVLNILRFEVSDPIGVETDSKRSDHVLETLAELRETINDFEKAYKKALPQQ